MGTWMRNSESSWQRKRLTHSAHVLYLPFQVGFKAKSRTTTTDLERNGLSSKYIRKDRKVKVDQRLAGSVSRDCSKSSSSWPEAKLNTSVRSQERQTTQGCLKHSQAFTRIE